MDSIEEQYADHFKVKIAWNTLKRALSNISEGKNELELFYPTYYSEIF